MFKRIKEAVAAFKPVKDNEVIDEEVLYYYKGVVTNVVDGDTYDILVSLGFDVYQSIRFRLAHYDTPEVRGEEREEGLRVSEKVREMIEGKTVIVKSHKKGSFQRYLAELWIDDTHLGDYLFENGDAKIFGK